MAYTRAFSIPLAPFLLLMVCQKDRAAPKDLAQIQNNYNYHFHTSDYRNFHSTNMSLSQDKVMLEILGLSQPSQLIQNSVIKQPSKINLRTFLGAMLDQFAIQKMWADHKNQT